MFRIKAGELFVDLLTEWGVDHIYGMPGDSINSLIEPLRKAQDKIRFIQVRHEEAGALAAASYAKLTGKIGVCMAIAGPGAIHLLNGLYDAKLDHVPVLAIAGQVETDLLGSDAFQEVNLERMFDDVAVYNQRVMSAEQLPTVLNQAIRMAYARKGPAVLTIPDDIPKFEVEGEARRTKPQIAIPEIFPRTEDLERARVILNQAKRPVILAGRGAKGARMMLQGLASHLGAPIVLTLPGKGAVPDEHPLCLGGLGLLGTRPSYSAMKNADTLIMVGTSYPFTGFLPDRARTIQIDSDPPQIGKRYPVDVGLAGDAGKTMEWLIQHTLPNEDLQFLRQHQQMANDWHNKLKEQENDNSIPIKPQAVVKAIQNIASDDAIISVDVGNVTSFMARNFKVNNQSFIVSSWLATLGCGLPGAIAGQLAYPEKQVFAVVGDGGFGMTMNDFVTAVKYQLPIIVVVFNNSKIAMIKFEQEVMGNLEYATDLTNPDFARYAEACGGIGYRVERPEELNPIFDKACAIRKPCIIDVLVDVNEAPMPSNISFAQASGYAKHMVKSLVETGKVDLPPI